jgi:hypothetical protein
VEQSTQTVVQRALLLAKQNFYVFPAGKNKRPLTPHGHLDASIDPEQIATWFSAEFPDAYIGIHTGRSELVVLDIDLRPDRNGYEELELSWHGVPDGAFEYATPSGGKHIWLAAPGDQTGLTQTPNYGGMVGIDRKAGSSYVLYYAPYVPEQIVLPLAPEWLLETRSKRAVGDSFDGGLDAWLEHLEDGEPDERVLKAIERIPDDEFGHNTLVERQYEMIRLGAEGAIGVRYALDILRDAWTRPPWNSEDYFWEFDSALESGIKKHGAELARIRSLPKYMDCIDLVGQQTVDKLLGSNKGKRHYFDVIRHLVGLPGLRDEQVAVLVWDAPSTKLHAREWGIDFLFANIASNRLKHQAPVENPAQGLEEEEDKPERFSLLSDTERQQAAESGQFIDRYNEWAAAKVNVFNAPYHLQNSLTILSLAFGGRIFVPLKTRAMGVNLFQIGLGESSTGKSESISLMNEVVRPYFADDTSYDIGSNPSPEALQAALLDRDGKAAFFNTDEAAAPLTELLLKSYTAGLTDRLTSYYEGLVPPMLRIGRPELNKSAITSFNMGMFGTPSKVTGLITKDQFESGFMARFLFIVGEPSVDDPHQYDETQSLERVKRETDPAALALAARLAYAVRIQGDRKRAVLATDEALDRLSVNRKAMMDAVREDVNFDMLNPSTRRLGDSVRKIATLLSVADYSDEIGMPHVLKAIECAEMFLKSAVTVARMVASSQFAREVDQVEQYIISQGGTVASSKVFHRFRNTDLRDQLKYVDALVFQGRIKRIEPTKDRGETLVINGGD